MAWHRQPGPVIVLSIGFRPMVEQHVRDPIVRSYWLNEYAGYGDHIRAEAISPIQNKVGEALIERKRQPGATARLA